MTVKSTILKEKKIIVKTLVPEEKMRLKLDRTNLMPDSIEDREFQSEFQLDIKIVNDKDDELVNLTLNYIVITTLEENDVYDKTVAANTIFTFLKSMYLSAANEMLRETSYPSIPLNINF